VAFSFFQTKSQCSSVKMRWDRWTARRVRDFLICLSTNSIKVDPNTVADKSKCISCGAVYIYNGKDIICSGFMDFSVIGRKERFSDFIWGALVRNSSISWHTWSVVNLFHERSN
jgi:hypothetical protein